MATTKLFLDMRGKSKDGKGSILIRLYHNGTSTTIATGIRISPDCWYNENVIRIPGFEAINAGLQEQKTKVDKAIALLSFEEDMDRMTASEIKRAITQNKTQKSKGHLISDVFNDCLLTGSLKEGTKDIYRTTLKKIIKFSGENTKIEQIDLKWLRLFDKYLSKTQGINGKAIFLRCLRAAYNYAMNIGITTQYPFKLFKIKQEQTQKRNISITLLREFYHYPTSERNSYYRDYFFLMFFLIGINTKDLLLAKKEQLVDGRLSYIREKTGKLYSVKIEPEADELLCKYKGKNEYLLEAMDHCKLYRSFAHQINDALKEIGEVKRKEIFCEDDLFAEPKIIEEVSPVIPGITTYFSRHTWATLAHELGISSDVIALALGHSPINRTTFIYIKPDQSKVDEANRRIIDYFFDY